MNDLPGPRPAAPPHPPLKVMLPLLERLAEAMANTSDQNKDGGPASTPKNPLKYLFCPRCHGLQQRSCYVSQLSVQRHSCVFFCSFCRRSFCASF